MHRVHKHIRQSDLFVQDRINERLSNKMDQIISQTNNQLTEIMAHLPKLSQVGGSSMDVGNFMLSTNHCLADPVVMDDVDGDVKLVYISDDESVHTGSEESGSEESGSEESGLEEPIEFDVDADADDASIDIESYNSPPIDHLGANTTAIECSAIDLVPVVRVKKRTSAMAYHKWSVKSLRRLAARIGLDLNEVKLKKSELISWIESHQQDADANVDVDVTHTPEESEGVGQTSNATDAACNLVAEDANVMLQLEQAPNEIA